MIPCSFEPSIEHAKEFILTPMHLECNKIFISHLSVFQSYNKNSNKDGILNAYKRFKNSFNTVSLKKLFIDYPVLTRMLCESIDIFVNIHAEMIKRLKIFISSIK